MTNATLPMEPVTATTGETNMGETPEGWLGRLFEYEYCVECGGDAEGHVLCLVPGQGTYFARCRTASTHTTHPDDGRSADRGEWPITAAKEADGDTAGVDVKTATPMESFQ